MESLRINPKEPVNFLYFERYLSSRFFFSRETPGMNGLSGDVNVVKTFFSENICLREF